MYLETRNSFAPHGLVDRHFKLARDWLVAFQNATCEGEARFGDRDFAQFRRSLPLGELERTHEPSVSQPAVIRHSGPRHPQLVRGRRFVRG